MINILTFNRVENKQRHLYETARDYIEMFLKEIQCFIQNSNKEFNKLLAEINLLKIKILYQLLCLVLKEKLDLSTINNSKNVISKDLTSFRIKESTLYENTKSTENFFKDIIFSLPYLCKIGDFLLPLMKDFEIDDNIINELNLKCLTNTIEIKDDDSSSFSNSSNLLKKKRFNRISTPEQNNNLKGEKIYKYFKFVGKSNEGAKIVSDPTSEKKTPQSDKKLSNITENKGDNLNTINNSSFAIFGESNHSNFNSIFEFNNPKKQLSSNSQRKYIDNLYIPENIPENSNFSFADRDCFSRKIFVLNNGFNNFSSSSKKSTNYSIISYPTVKEFSIIQEPINSNLDQIIIDNNNSMRSNQHNYHRGINRRLPELQYLPRTKKKQLSGKKKKIKGQSSLLYQYFDNLNKSNSEKSPSDDENSEPNIKGINNSFYNRNPSYDKEESFHMEDGRSSRKKSIPIKNLNNKEFKPTFKDELFKNFKSSSNYPQNRPVIKSSLYNRDESPITDKSEEEIIAYSTPDNVNKKFFNPKPKICVNLFNTHH